MKQNYKSKKWTYAIIIFIALILKITVTYAAFTVTPQINPSTSGELFTYQDLDCRWTIDTSTDVNITWYKSGDLNTTYNTSCTAGVPCYTQGSGTISQSLTTKGDIWTCEVQYFNGTDLESKNVSRVIAEAAPTTPRVFLNAMEILNNSITSIGEDNVTIFKVNSTDADNDPVTYPTVGQIPSFCSLNILNGDFTCSPTEESDNGLHNATVFAQSGETEIKLSGFRFYINVTPSNDPPSFTPTLQNKQRYEGVALNYTIYGADPENNVPFNFSIQSDIPELVIIPLSNNSASIRFNHSGQDIAQFSDRGNHTVNITISDSGSPSMSYTSEFNLEVIPTNHLSNTSFYVENSGALIQGGELRIHINATDIDNDTLTFYTDNMQLYNITYSSTNKTDPSGTSFANATIYIPALSNDHVIYSDIVLTVFDGKENIDTNINLNITNLNDNPVIYETSNNPSNTLDNTNISNLTAYNGVLFSYYVNATDIDSLTYAGETLTYTSNDSSFPINSSTGLITFTSVDIGAHHVLITVTDSGSLTDDITALINLYDNSNPYFTTNLELNCAEYDQYNNPNNCTLNISNYVDDPDAEDYVESYWTNSTLFSINDSTGIIDFMANQSIIGNYSFLINITDTRGAMNSTTIQVFINNTNNYPTIMEITEPSTRLIVEGIYYYGIDADDDDLDLSSYENLSFNYTVEGPDNSIFTLTKTGVNEATLTVHPLNTSHAGNYTLNITVTDFYGNSSFETITFFIYNITSPPNITQIRPFGTPITNNSVNNSWTNRSNLGSSTSVTILENTTYLFNQTSTYDTQYANSLSNEWYYDGSLESTDESFSISFDFFSSGIHNLTFITTDDFNRSDSFNWTINITNVNRPVTLLNPLTNLTGVNAVNGSTTYGSYMTYYSSQPKFYDPDDDINSNNIIEDNELTTSFNATSCSHAGLTFINNSLKVQTISIGECLVVFTATDSANSSVTINTDNVLINITYISNETTPEDVPVSSRGGGGATRTITIPMPEEVEKPKPLEIITPKLVTIYRNATVVVPIILNNTWNDTLEGITLSVTTNATNVSVYLDRTYFPRLFTNKIEEVTLTITNYKSEGHYEIQVYANIVNPEFKDTATIYVNSADTTSEGEQLDTKISFARDLLSSNPECQELNELLNQAKKELTQNNYQATSKLVDSVINGCKYLVNAKTSNVEKASKQFLSRFNWKSDYTKYFIIGGFALLFIVALFYIIKKDKNEDF